MRLSRILWLMPAYRDRDLQIARLVAAGLTDQQLAERFRVSAKTAAAWRRTPQVREILQHLHEAGLQRAKLRLSENALNLVNRLVEVALGREKASQSELKALIAALGLTFQRAPGGRVTIEQAQDGLRQVTRIRYADSPLVPLQQEDYPALPEAQDAESPGH